MAFRIQIQGEPAEEKVIRNLSLVLSVGKGGCIRKCHIPFFPKSSSTWLSHHLPEGRNVQGAESLLPHWGFLGPCKWRLSSEFIMAAVDAMGPRPCWKVGALADGLLSLLVRLASAPFLQLTRPKILVVFL